MSRTQKWVVVAGLLVLLLMCLFPPYVGIWLLEGDNVSQYLGYHSLFSAPTPRQVYEAIQEEETDDVWFVKTGYTSEISTERLLIQVICCVALFSAVVVLLSIYGHAPARQIGAADPRETGPSGND